MAQVLVVEDAHIMQGSTLLEEMVVMAAVKMAVKAAVKMAVKAVAEKVTVVVVEKAVAEKENMLREFKETERTRSKAAWTKFADEQLAAQRTARRPLATPEDQSCHKFPPLNIAPRPPPHLSIDAVTAGAAEPPKAQQQPRKG